MTFTPVQTTKLDAKPRLLLADDHAMVAEGLSRLLETNFELVGHVTAGDALLREAVEKQPEVIITDITMPLLNGLDAIRLLRRRGVTAKAVVLTMHSDPFLAAEALRAGASAYVLKHAAGEELIRAIREVLAGGVYVSLELGSRVLRDLASSSGTQRSETRLTPRQRQVLQLTAEGRSMKQIARILGISRRTAESHKYQLMRTLGVGSTPQLVQHAIRFGLISVDAQMTTPTTS